MKSFFLKEYFWPYENKTFAWIHAIIIGFFTFGLCYWVRPFDLENYIQLEDFFILSITVSFINVFIISFINIMGLPFLIPIHFKKWYIWKEVFWTLLIIILCCTISPFFIELLFRKNSDFNVYHFINIVSWALIGSTVPLALSILINQMRFQLIKQRELSQIQTETILSKEESENCLDITTDTEIYKLKIDKVIVIKAEANYIVIYMINDSGTLSIDKLRCTLTTFEEKLTSYDNYFRCHRSYIINLKMVENYTGSASKGFILFNHYLNFDIPVSRKKGKEIKNNQFFPNKK